MQIKLADARSGVNVDLLDAVMKHVLSSEDAKAVIVSPTCAASQAMIQESRSIGKYSFLVGNDRVKWCSAFNADIHGFNPDECRYFIDEALDCEQFFCYDEADDGEPQQFSYYTQSCLRDAYLSCTVELTTSRVWDRRMTLLRRLIDFMKSSGSAVCVDRCGSCHDCRKVRVLVKRLDKSASLPERAHDDDAGADVRAVSRTYSIDGDVITYGTGLAFAVPRGYWLDLRPRSSVYKTGLVLANSVGTIDAGYRGEVKALFYQLKLNGTRHAYDIGDKVGQIIVQPNVSPMDVEFVEVDELPSENDRNGGFGSTGK